MNFYSVGWPLLILSFALLWGTGFGLLLGRKRPGWALIYVLFTFFVALPALAQPPAIRGTIVSGAYIPPDNVMVTWVCPGQPNVIKRLNKSVQWTQVGDNDQRLGRYGEGDRALLGSCFIGPVGSEQQGQRCLMIGRELLGHSPCPTADGRCQGVYDICVGEIGGSRPATCCDYERVIGKPDPIADRCECSGSGGGKPPVTTTPLPVDIALENNVLSFAWAASKKGDVVNFQVLAGQLAVGELRSTGSGQTESFAIALRPYPPGATLTLTARVKNKTPSQVVLNAPELPPPPPPPPPVDDFEKRLEEFWRLRLKPLLREWYRPTAASTGAIKPSVFPD